MYFAKQHYSAPRLLVQNLKIPSLKDHLVFVNYQELYKQIFKNFVGDDVISNAFRRHYHSNALLLHEVQ